MNEAAQNETSNNTPAGTPVKFAVIRTGGKQYRVTPGQKITVERLEGEVGSELALAEVLLVSDGKSAPSIGTPLVAGSSVQAKIVAHSRDKKVIIYKKRRRKGYTKKQGHRQEKTQLLIQEII